MTNDEFMKTKPITNAIPAFVRVRQYGGTYIATAKVGLGKTQTASCTMGREWAAKRAAAKVLGCTEDEIELTPAVEGSESLFWASRK